MIYKTSNPIEADKARLRLDKLIEKGAKVDMTEKRGNRTLQQNNYLHLLLSYYGLEIGYTLEEMKEIFKRDICPSIFKYNKGNHTFYRSTAELNTLEMTKAIEHLKEHAEIHGYPLPDAEDQDRMDWLINQLETYNNYMRL